MSAWTKSRVVTSATISRGAPRRAAQAVRKRALTPESQSLMSSGWLCGMGSASGNRSHDPSPLPAMETMLRCSINRPYGLTNYRIVAHISYAASAEILSRDMLPNDDP